MIKPLLLETDRLIIKRGTIDNYVRIHEFDFNELQASSPVYIRMDPNEVRGLVWKYRRMV